jgi:hypothetical protein
VPGVPPDAEETDGGVVARPRARVVPAIPAGSWAAAGFRFFKRTISEPVPIGRYTGKISGVPLTGGQASGPVSAGGTLTLSAGPQGLGTAWYPAQVTLSTTTGALDTSTALVYLGVGGVPTTLVATVYSGNGTAALAIPAMQPGDLVIVQWSGGHPGDTASFNILGTMDALTTGG